MLRTKAQKMDAEVMINNYHIAVLRPMLEIKPQSSINQLKTKKTKTLSLKSP
jgi:hypothetical protein